MTNTTGLGRTLRRGSVSASKRSLSRSSTSAIRSAAKLKPVDQRTEMVRWGCNMSNQLGLKSSRPFIMMPKQCTWNISIAQISCGLDHCALVTIQGHVYTFGSNQNRNILTTNFCKCADRFRFSQPLRFQKQIIDSAQ